MKNKINKFRNTFLMMGFCFLNTINYGQTTDTNIDKKTDLSSLYNESKLCDAVKKIQTELGKSNKSGIIGEKIKKSIAEEKMLYYDQRYTSLIQIDNFEGSISESKTGYLFYRYTGYITVPPFENNTYEKEFELISTQLKNCLNKKPQRSREWEFSDNFLLENSRVEVRMNPKKSRLTIEITVMK